MVSSLGQGPCVQRPVRTCHAPTLASFLSSHGTLHLALDRPISFSDPPPMFSAYIMLT